MLIPTVMKEVSENTREDKVKIIITFSIIILVAIGVLLVAFGFFDMVYN
jgi:hypothetical protein